MYKISIDSKYPEEDIINDDQWDSRQLGCDEQYVQVVSDDDQKLIDRMIDQIINNEEI